MGTYGLWRHITEEFEKHCSFRALRSTFRNFSDDEHLGVGRVSHLVSVKLLGDLDSVFLHSRCTRSLRDPLTQRAAGTQDSQQQ